MISTSWLGGELPAELTGALYRIGPNPQFPPRDDNYHWFVGDGMVHAFHLEGGKARYLNRWVRTPKWQAEHAAGRALFGSWGNPATTDPSVMGTDGGVANTNIVWHGGKLLALEEGHRPFAVDPKTLAPQGYQTFGGDLMARFTAHPKTDPETGEMMFFGYSAGAMPLSNIVSYGVLSADGRLLRQDLFEAPFASMVHDFMATSRHVLFPILPLTGSLQRAMSGKPAFAWEPEKGAFVGVMARDAGVDTIRWFETEANYVFHVMNAWEEGEKIIADVMQYEHAPPVPKSGWVARRAGGGAALPLDLRSGGAQQRHQAGLLGRSLGRVPAPGRAAGGAFLPARLVCGQVAGGWRRGVAGQCRPRGLEDRRALGARSAGGRRHLRAGVRAPAPPVRTKAMDGSWPQLIAGTRTGPT